MNRRQCFATLSLAASILIHAPIRAQTAQRSSKLAIGNDGVVVPYPEGFVDITESLPDIFDLGARLTPQANRQVAFYVAQADVEARLRADPMKLERYLAIQVPRAAERVAVSQSEFRELKVALRSQWRTTAATAEADANAALDKIRKHFDGISSVRVGELLDLGVLAESARSLSRTRVASVSVEGATHSETETVATTTTAILVGQKFLYLVVRGVCKSQDDLTWVQETTKAWIVQILRADGT